jgi:alkylation response protein AidB-like acyl-CoA dehydrogenase
VSLAGEADLSLVVAKTSDEPGHRDIAMFAVEGAAPGIRVERLYRLPVAAYLPIGEVVFEDVAAAEVVPAGQGLRAALGAIDVARCDIAAIACGLHADAMERALSWARERPAFGRTVLDFQGIQWMLADAETDLVAGRLLVGEAARVLGTPEGSVAVAHAKRFAPDAALRAAVTCSEVMGAYGWLEDAGMVRSIALAKMLQVVDGTAEVQRIVVARDLVRRAGGRAGRVTGLSPSSGSPPGSRSRGTS